MDDNRAIIIIGDKATGMDRMAAEMAMKNIKVITLQVEKDDWWHKLRAEEEIAISAIKAPDLSAMLGPANRADRRGHRHGTEYWKPQRPANKNIRK